MTCHITTIGWTKCYQDCKLVRLHAKQGRAQNYILYLLTKCSDLQQKSHVSVFFAYYRLVMMKKKPPCSPNLASEHKTG